MPGSGSVVDDLRPDVLPDELDQLVPVVLVSAKGPTAAGVHGVPFGPGTVASAGALLVTAEAAEDGVPNWLVEDAQAVLTEISVNVWKAQEAHAELGGREVGTVDGRVVVSNPPPQWPGVPDGGAGGAVVRERLADVDGDLEPAEPP